MKTTRLSDRRRRLALIGAIGLGKPPMNGEEVKNQLLLAFLSERYPVQVVDTADWKRKPWVVARVLWTALMGRQDTTILSASSGSVHTLLRILSPFRRAKAKVIYMVVGGYVHLGIGNGRFKADAFSGLKAIVMQGDSMRAAMEELGICSPLHVMPNSKPLLRTYGDASKYSDPKVRFLFLGRVSESKGTLLVFKALEHPLLRERTSEFSVDFFGKIEEVHRADFESGIRKNLNCGYAGYLDVTNDAEKSYGMLSAYHAMLFPTFWMGEGFPGVVIDCYVAGVPVIASDWNMNREVIHDGVTGRIIPVQDPSALAEAMASVLDDRQAWAGMSVSCHGAAAAFDSEKVLSRHLEPLL